MSSQSTAAKRKKLIQKMTVSGPLKKIKLFGMYKDIHCSAISEKSQNSSPYRSSITGFN